MLFNADFLEGIVDELLEMKIPQDIPESWKTHNEQDMAALFGDTGLANFHESQLNGLTGDEAAKEVFKKLQPFSGVEEVPCAF